MENLIFLFIGSVVLLLIDRVIIVRKLRKIESEMDEHDFVMRPPKWMRTLGLIWVAIGVFVIVMAVRESLLVLGFILFVFTVLGTKPLRKKIVIQGNTAVIHKFFRKVKFTFDDIAEVMTDHKKATIFDEVAKVIRNQYTEVKFYNFNGKKRLMFTSDWFGFRLMMQRLFNSGKIPWLETNENKSDRQNLSEFMTFLIDFDLTNWYSFSKRKAVKVGFKLHKHDLTDKGQYLFTSGAVVRWAEFVNQGGDISDFSLLNDALVEYESKEQSSDSKNLENKEEQEEEN